MVVGNKYVVQSLIERNRSTIRSIPMFHVYCLVFVIRTTLHAMRMSDKSKNVEAHRQGTVFVVIVELQFDTIAFCEQTF